MTTRPVVAVLLALVLASAGGCGGGSEEQPAATSAPATAAEGDGTASGADWADGVCAATLDLQASVDELGQSIQVDVGSGQAALDQLKEQVAAQAAAVTADAEALGDALRAVPEQADPDVAAAAADLQADREALGESVDNLGAAVTDLAAAADASSAIQALPAVAEQLVATRLQATAVQGSLQELSTTGSEAARASIADADACGDLLVQP
jgi:hypothetical protein